MNYVSLKVLLKQFDDIKSKLQTLPLDRNSFAPLADWECAENMKELRKFVVDTKRMSDAKVTLPIYILDAVEKG